MLGFNPILSSFYTQFSCSPIFPQAKKIILVSAALEITIITSSNPKRIKGKQQINERVDGGIITSGVIKLEQ